MKLILTLLFSVLTTIPMTLAQEGAMKFKISNAPSRNCIIAYYYGSKQYIVGEEQASGEAENIPLTLNEKGEGTFYKKDLPAGVYMLVFQPDNQYIEFIYEEKSLSITADFDHLNTSFQSDSKANELMYSRNAFLADLEKRQEQIEQRKATDPGYADSQKDMSQLQTDMEAFDRKLFAANPGNLFVKMLQAMEEPVVPESITDQNARFFYYRNHYFDALNPSEEWLLRTPFFEARIDDYTENLVYQTPDSLKVAWDGIIARAAGNETMYKYLVIKALNTYAASKIIGMDAVYAYLLEKYYFSGKAPWADEETLNKLKSRYEYIRYNLLGMAARNFSGKTSDNVPFHLNDVKSTYTILMFTDEDTGFGRQQAEEWMSLKNRLPASVKLVGIYKGAKAEQLATIKQTKGYYWEMVALDAMDKWEDIVRPYDLTTVPRLYILDSDKRILLKQIDPETAVKWIREEMGM